MTIKEENKIDCLTEVDIRLHFLEHVLENLKEVEGMLYDFAHGKALVEFDNGKRSRTIKLKRYRLNEQNKKVYEELDTGDEFCVFLHSSTETLRCEIEKHGVGIYKLGKKIEEGDELKKFVAKGRDSL